VAQAGGNVGSAGRFESPAPQAGDPLLVLLEVELLVLVPLPVVELPPPLLVLPLELASLPVVLELAPPVEPLLPAPPWTPPLPVPGPEPEPEPEGACPQAMNDVGRTTARAIVDHDRALRMTFISSSSHQSPGDVKRHGRYFSHAHVFVTFKCVAVTSLFTGV
jgi:hypothetical protein